MSSDSPSWDSPAAIASFRSAEAASATRLAPIFLDDDTIKRFLRARRGEPGAALSMLLEHQAWRKAETPWWPLAAAPAEGLREDFACLKAYLDGEDADGGPITWVRAALHDKNEDRAQLKRFLSFLSDESVARMERREPKGALGMNIVVDFTGFGYSAGFDVNAGMLIVQTMSAHYPERLRRIFMTVRAGGPRYARPRSRPAPLLITAPPPPPDSLAEHAFRLQRILGSPKGVS